VIRITITTEAFEAVVATLHLGSVGYSSKRRVPSRNCSILRVE
jgi:hypothetical protein